MRGVELIVVDDVSTDQSFKVAENWLEANQHSFTRVVLARHDANSGLPYTRNIGFTLAMANYVFPIDADNLIYTRCLERCHAVMQQHQSAVVYHIVERFGAESGLINLAQWSRDTFRLGNQVDAMALISQFSWAKVGGYNSTMRLGWEDYELWLRFCEAGLTGIRLPILGRYRVHQQSMTKTVTSKAKTVSTLKRTLQARYTWLGLAPTVDEQTPAGCEHTDRPASMDGQTM